MQLSISVHSDPALLFTAFSLQECVRQCEDLCSRSLHERRILAWPRDGAGSIPLASGSHPQPCRYLAANRDVVVPENCVVQSR